jgi:NAD(P)-dependent dehydrogenase (short-subunit alcohol dehydrogenase family)
VHDDSLKGKRAVVTASAGGIGEAIAVGLAKAGADLAICDIDLGGLDRVGEEIRAQGVHLVSIGCDVGVRAQVEGFATRVLSEFDAVDVLVNNAGRSGPGDVVGTDPDDWRAVMAVNLDASFLLARAFVPGMQAQGWGRLIQIASLGGKRPFPNAASYSTSKAALIALTRSMALDYVGDGITSNAVCPSWTRTDMAERFATFLIDALDMSHDDAYDTMANMNPHRRLLEPSEVASLVLMLAGDDAGSISGQAISVDGGAALS